MNSAKTVENKSTKSSSLAISDSSFVDSTDGKETGKVDKTKQAVAGGINMGLNAVQAGGNALQLAVGGMLGSRSF